MQSEHLTACFPLVEAGAQAGDEVAEAIVSI